MFTGLVEEMGQVLALEEREDGGVVLKVRTPDGVVLSDVSVGDSIAVNGVCLTVTAFHFKSNKIGSLGKVGQVHDDAEPGGAEPGASEEEPGGGGAAAAGPGGAAGPGAGGAAGGAERKERISGADWWFTAGLAPETLRRSNLGDLKVDSLVNLERSLAASARFGGHCVQGHVDGTGTIKALRKEKDSLWVTVAADKTLLRYIVEKGYVAIDGTSLTVCAVTDETFEFMLISHTQEKVIIPKKKVGEKVNIEVDIMGKYVEKFLRLDGKTKA